MSCLEYLGPSFVDNPAIIPLVEPTLDFLLQHFVKSVIKSSKKFVLRHVKYILMLVFVTKNASAETSELARIFISIRA